MNDQHILDNQIWPALTGRQQSLALRVGQAARYRPEVSCFAAVEAMTPAAFEDLRSLTESGETIRLTTPDPVAAPAGWAVDQAIPVDQMVWSGQAATPTAGVTALGEEDVPEMLALAELTRPGPFLPETIRMGRYFGVRSGEGRLLAMAGERFRLDGHTEISAVCTHPDARGRGLAGALLDHLTALIADEGITPHLHVVPDNPAKRVYERHGFRVRRRMAVTLLTAE